MEQHIKQIDPAILAEQKAYKASKESFREAIHQLSIAQYNTKQNRKTDRFPRTLTRVMEPAIAAATHRLNRWELRHLHIAYALFRNKKVPEHYYVVSYGKGIVSVGKSSTVYRANAEEPNPSLILKLLKQHVQKSTVPFPKEEVVRDSPGGHAGC